MQDIISDADGNGLAAFKADAMCDATNVVNEALKPPVTDEIECFPRCANCERRSIEPALKQDGINKIHSQTDVCSEHIGHDGEFAECMSSM